MLHRPRIALIAAAIVAVVGCSGERAKPRATENPLPRPFKIGVMTGTPTQGAEDFRGGEQVERAFPGRVKHITYPDNFPSESMTVVAQLSGLAADHEVRVILVAQAVPGSVAAARRIRQSRPDLLIGFVGPHEDPDSVDQACDLAIQPDQIARGRSIIESARRMGARHFVHYSFARHMAQPLLARRRDIMKAECLRRGMTFDTLSAPDPTGAGGLSAAQRFILEDVPRQLAKLGPATAFYATNDGMQEPLIKAILTARAGYFVEQDMPAPSAGYPEALGFKLPPEAAADMDSVNAGNKRLIAENGMSGHFGTWAAPVDMVAIRASAKLLVDAVDRKADLRDSATVFRYLAAEAGGTVKIRRHDPNGNQWMIVLEHITY